MSSPWSFTVAVAEDGERVDRFLRAHLPGASRRDCQALLDDGGVRADGRRVRKGDRLRAGQIVAAEQYAPRDEWRLVPAAEATLRVVYEDAAIIAVDKPAGQPTVALRPDDPGTLAAALVARYPELRDVGPPLEAGVVHRLDNDTSGLVVAARTPTVRATLRERWSTPEVRKRYLAWVHGRVSSAGAHDAPIAHAGARRMAIDSRGRPATTRYTPRDAPHDDMTLLEIELIGGVRHQIRVHLADRGHPVLGDTLYGLPEPGASRLLLHAWRIDMPHPVDAAQRLAIEAPPPDDFTP